MYRITFECQMITPLFMHGANQSTSELRPPSIKGSMRFWWRALCGHLAKNQPDYTRLKEKEALLFGDNGQYRGKSKVSIQTKVINQRALQSFKQDQGMRYLFYSVLMRNNKPNYRYPDKFKVILSSYDKTALREASYAFWLLASWGGLGSRARRGAGNFQIQKVSDPDNICEDLTFRSEATSQEELRHFFTQHLNLIKQQIGYTVRSSAGHGQRSPAPFAQFDGSKLYILPKESSWEGALNKVGQKFREFRLRSSPDYENVKQFIAGQSFHGQTIEKAVFGLPIQYRFRSLEGMKAFIEGPRRENREKNYSRSASPIIFRVYATRDGYFPLILHLNKQLLPDDQRIILRSGNQDKRVQTLPQPSQDIIHRFLNSFEHKVEVPL